VSTTVYTLDHIVAAQKHAIDQFVESGLAGSTPQTVQQQKAIFIALVVIAAIIGTLVIAAFVILIGIVFEKLRDRLRRHRRKERYELIPTYHNVRALRKLEPTCGLSPTCSISVESLPPPPTLPKPTPRKLNNLQDNRQETQVSTFKACN
jgi:hypothetical protein